MAQLSASSQPAAPAPLVPRLRSQSVGRTSSTFPELDDTTSTRPKSAGRARDFIRRRSLSRSGRASSLPRSEAESETPLPLPPVPAIPIHHRVGGSSKGLSQPAKRGYVDLLDAQSEFQPADFHSRLEASGARNYGEDVAERNLGVNGVDLTSPAVKTFYALTGGAALAYRSDGSAVDVHGNMYQPGTIPQNLRDAEPKPEVVDAKLSRGKIVPRRVSPLEITRPTSSSGHAHRDLDRNGATDDDILGNIGRAINQRVAALSKRNSISTSPSTTPQQPRPRPHSVWEAGAGVLGGYEAAVPPVVPRVRPRTSAKEAEKTSDWPMTNQRQTSSRDGKKDKTKSTSPRRRKGSSFTKKTLREFDDGTDSSSSETDARLPHGRGRGLRPRQDQADGMTHRSKGHARSATQYTSEADRGYDYDKPLPSRPSTSQPSSSRKASHHNPRSRSIGGYSGPGPSKLDDIIENIPARTSSLIPINMAMTPTSTLSGHSSNVPSHYDSLHTASTSVDLSYETTSKSRHSRHGSGGAKRHSKEAGRGHRRHRSSDDVKLKLVKAFAAASNLKSDGHTSTTEGSDYEDHRRRKRVDDDLLRFKEGSYGGVIDGLPGLPGSGGADTASALPAPTSMWAGGPADRRSTAGNAKSQPRSAPRTSNKPLPSKPKAPAYASEDSDSGFLSSDEEYAETLRRIPTRMLAALVAEVQAAEASRKSGNEGYATVDLSDLLDDMPDSTKLDVRTAVGLRKAIKRQKRLDALEKSERGKGKMPMR